MVAASNHELQQSPSVTGDILRSPLLAQNEQPDVRMAARQLANTLAHLALWIVLVRMVRQGVSWAFILPVMVIASALLVHHLPRLLPRFVSPLPPRQRDPGLSHGAPYRFRALRHSTTTSVANDQLRLAGPSGERKERLQ